MAKASSIDTMKELAEACNTFGLKLYHELEAGHTINIIFSPLSIFTALAMAYMGARGNTARQMQGVMALGPLGDSVHKALKYQYSDLIGPSQSQDCILKLANRLYGQKNFQFQSEFLHATQDFYGAKMEALDLESEFQAINTWVEEQTEGRIKDLISPGVLTSETRLVLVNAIYFKGEWLRAFRERNTFDQRFYVSPLEQILIPMMHQTNMFEYHHDNLLQCKVLRMYYTGRELRMVFVLPDLTDGLDDLETNLSAEVMRTWNISLKSVVVEVTLPKLNFTKSLNLAEILSKLGMTDLFSRSSADLTGISTKEEDELFVSEVIHKAFLEVNEEGCEAAAATVIGTRGGRGGFRGRQLQREMFIADHPFLFFIQHSLSGLILFMGRVTRPDLAM